MVNDKQIKVYGGIDTHADTHHIAVIDAAGRRLADVQVPTTAPGYQAALRFLGSWPTLVSVGIECTGSYGAAVTHAVRDAGHQVFEDSRPNRFDRRLRGEKDVFDALSAPEYLRARYRGLSNTTLIATLTASRPGSTPVSAAEATAYTRRLLARRWLSLTEQIDDLAGHMQRLLQDHAPALMNVFGCGQDSHPMVASEEP